MRRPRTLGGIEVPECWGRLLRTLRFDRLHCVQLYWCALACISRVVRCLAGEEARGKVLWIGGVLPTHSAMRRRAWDTCEEELQAHCPQSLLNDPALLLQIKDDDVGGGSSTQPVSVWREDKGVDLVTGVQQVEVLRFVKVPQHGGSVLST